MQSEVNNIVIYPKTIYYQLGQTFPEFKNDQQCVAEILG